MMKKGKIIAGGAPNDVMTGENLEAVYGIKANIRFARISVYYSYGKDCGKGMKNN
jgi:ABC-type cobalamin/Fe3+-siderophores transport system ATPase subunit